MVVLVIVITRDIIFLVKCIIQNFNSDYYWYPFDNLYKLYKFLQSVYKNNAAHIIGVKEIWKL